MGHQGKMHEMIFNVPRFVNHWKTTGLLSEQERESKHAAVYAELRSLACVRNHAERLQLILERGTNFLVQIKTLKPNVRLCQKCKDDQTRTFLHAIVQYVKQNIFFRALLLCHVFLRMDWFCFIPDLILFGQIYQ